MITGQMRTFKECYDNIYNNIINFNQGYYFDIYILTEYFGLDGGSIKNNYKNDEKNIDDFKNSIKKIYGNYLKDLIIEEDNSHYPKYLDNFAPWLCLFKNKQLFNSINKDYDIYIRIRPDIYLTNYLDLKLFKLNTIQIITSNHIRPCWLHNRDWDHMCISDKKGMEIWCEYYSFLSNYPPMLFNQEIRFNNVGNWIFNEKQDRSVISTQLFLKYVINNNYNLEFDAFNCFTIVKR
jgi:hypothetical protein